MKVEEKKTAKRVCVGGGGDLVWQEMKEKET